jgi:16S rRNA processing protein RimM
MPAGNARPAGSPTAGEPAFLAAGKIQRLCPQLAVYAGESHHRLIISSQRPHQEGLLLAFEGIDTPELAGGFRNHVLYVPLADAPELSEGEYYYHELIGLNVMDETGQSLGILTEIMETGANDVYVVVDPSGTEVLLPAIPEVVLDVDLGAKTMRVHLLPGLIGEE